jgi:hypothetical protein
MGLDAIVYKNAKRLLEAYGDDRIEVDGTTGEACQKDGVQISIPVELRIALRQRLGNMDEIRFLRGEVKRLFGDSDSYLNQKVLYSSSHSGDILSLSEMQVISQEVDVLRQSNDVRLQTFVETMDSLIRASRAELNPIVFV